MKANEPLRWSFKPVRFNVPIHFLNPLDSEDASPCGDKSDKALVTNEREHVTCASCRLALRRKPRAS